MRPQSIHTEGRRPLSDVHSITMENSARLVKGGDAHPPPFYYIYHHVQSCSERSSLDGRYNLPISSLSLCTLGEEQSRPFVYPSLILSNSRLFAVKHIKKKGKVVISMTSPFKLILKTGMVVYENNMFRLIPVLTINVSYIDLTQHAI
jgi:hypothetical protein